MICRFVIYEGRLEWVEKKVGGEEMELVNRDNKGVERQGSRWRGYVSQGKFCENIINFSVFKSQ